MSYLAHHLDTYLMGVTVTSEIVRMLLMTASEAMDTVLIVLDPKKEANVDASSSDYTTIDAINHNTLNEPVIEDDIVNTRRHVDDLYTFEHNLLAAQATNIDLPFNWRGYLQRI